MTVSGFVVRREGVYLSGLVPGVAAGWGTFQWAAVYPEASARELAEKLGGVALLVHACGECMRPKGAGDQQWHRSWCSFGVPEAKGGAR